MRNYRLGLYSAWDEASKQFPKDIVRRRQRFAQILREQQGLEPSDHELRKVISTALLQEVVS